MTHQDWEDSLKYVGKYGLLPADALHVSIALKVKAHAIASFDEDFRTVGEVKVVPRAPEIYFLKSPKRSCVHGGSQFLIRFIS